MHKTAFDPKQLPAVSEGGHSVLDVPAAMENGRPSAELESMQSNHLLASAVRKVRQQLLGRRARRRLDRRAERKVWRTLHERPRRP